MKGMHSERGLKFVRNESVRNTVVNLLRHWDFKPGCMPVSHYNVFA